MINNFFIGRINEKRKVSQMILAKIIAPEENRLPGGCFCRSDPQ